MEPPALLDLMHEAADAVRAALGRVTDWGPSGARAGQYAADLVADDAATAVLRPSGVAILSEESGSIGGDIPVLVVVDPLDGSTNASRGLPWFATSLCAIDHDGPLAAVVVNQANGIRYEAVRDGGARRDGIAIAPSGCTDLGHAVVAVSGYPGRHLGWAQYRSLGAAALDLCAVADGTLDAFADCHPVASLGPWDYLGGGLVCLEAGAVVGEVDGRDLAVTDHRARRRPIAGATPSLMGELLAAYPGFGRRQGDGAGGGGPVEAERSAGE